MLCSRDGRRGSTEKSLPVAIEDKKKMTYATLRSDSNTGKIFAILGIDPNGKEEQIVLSC